MQDTENKSKKIALRIDDPVQPYLLTLKEASKRYGLTIWALRELIWAGEVPVVQFQRMRKMYVVPKDLEKAIERNKRKIR